MFILYKTSYELQFIKQLKYLIIVLEFRPLYECVFIVSFNSNR